MLENCHNSESSLEWSDKFIQERNICFNHLHINKW